MDRVENQDADRLDDVEPLHWCQLYLHHRAWPRPKPQKAGGYEGFVWWTAPAAGGLCWGWEGNYPRASAPSAHPLSRGADSWSCWQ